jgi:predicted acetyltransferase
LSIEIRACRPDEFPVSASPISHYSGRAPGPEFSRQFVERFGALLPSDRMHAAFDDGAIVGSGGVFPFEMSVPGGFVRAAGVTMVGVLPTHRRRGIFRGLMRAQLDDVHERGEPIAYLWASDDALYGRFGYGIASFSANVEIPSDRTAFYRDFETAGAVRLVDVDEALAPFSRVQRAAAAQHPGMFVRTPEWWRNKRLSDPEWGREGGGEMSRALLELDGRPAGYALYRLHFKADRGIPQGFTSVIEAVGDSPEATRAIWRFLLDIDWMQRVRAGLLPLDHELLLLLREPRRLTFSHRDGLWVRIVDVGAALNARVWRPAEPVTIEVVDGFCPWNAGVWELSADGVARSTKEPELRLDVSALGSAYLGGFTFGELARAGRVEELVAGTLDRADTLFRTDRYPWCPEIF